MLCLQYLYLQFSEEYRKLLPSQQRMAKRESLHLVKETSIKVCILSYLDINYVKTYYLFCENLLVTQSCSLKMIQNLHT